MEALPQQFGKEVVVAIPIPLVVQRDSDVPPSKLGGIIDKRA